MTDRKPIAALTKLVNDAGAAGLTVKIKEPREGHPFSTVIVSDPATGKGMYAEWWDGDLVREFNYAATLAAGAKSTKRAPSLKAARTHVGL